MGKMFLTVPQAAKRIGCTERQIIQWFTDGRLQEFRDHDVSMAKTEQIELLAKDWKRERLSQDDKSLLELSLLELSQHEEDTSLGADLMEDVYAPDTTEKDRKGATSHCDASRGDRLPAMSISSKGSPFPFRLLVVCFVIIAASIFIPLGLWITKDHQAKPASKPTSRVVENAAVVPVLPSVKYKISILLGDKVYKTITVSKRVEFVNGGVSWIEDNGHMGYCSGQFLIETIDGN